MHPTFDLDFFELPVYSTLVGLGMVLGLATAYVYLRFSLGNAPRGPAGSRWGSRDWRSAGGSATRSRRASMSEIFLDGALIVMAAGWIGARAYHVAMHWDYYSARPEEITQFGLGGLAVRGAFIVGVIALALYAQVREVSFWRLADAAALGLALGQAIGWVGALVQGANYGIVSDSPAAIDLANLYGLVEPRSPLQHVEIAMFAFLFIGLIALASRHPRRGTLFLTYVLVASLANVALGFVRGDETLYLGVLRVDQIVDAIFVLLAVVGLLWRIKTPHRGASTRPDVWYTRENLGNGINGF